ncbi:MAG TPA: hypothetical protein VH912_16670 [Streptosporangiaceae bacterium]|jgi:hypothetical protein
MGNTRAAIGLVFGAGLIVYGAVRGSWTPAVIGIVLIAVGGVRALLATRRSG